MSTSSAGFDVACFPRHLFDKTVFHEFVVQIQNERRRKKKAVVVLLVPSVLNFNNPPRK